MNPPGWFVDARGVILLCLLAATSILLAAKSALDDHATVKRARRANEIIDSLSRGRWVQVQAGDTIVTVVRARKWPFQGRGH